MSLSYQAIKSIHLAAVTLTIIGFIIRAFLAINNSSWLKGRVIKILPHIIDTILFGSGLTLLWQAKFYPTTNNWMAIKLILIFLYLICGFYVLKLAKFKYQNWWGWLYVFFC